MIQYYRIIRESAARVAEAANGAIDALNDGRVEQEPAFTDRMLGRIEEAMTGFTSKGIVWKAKTLTDRAAGSQEHSFGADFMGVLDLNLPNFKVTKGFLAQAKLLEPDDSMPQRERQNLKNQCEQMLQLSPDSFVFLYNRSRVSVVPAISIASSNDNPYAFYSRGIARFFEEHFQSFIGDRAISAPNVETLEQLRRRYEARSLLLLKATATGQYTERNHD